MKSKSGFTIVEVMVVTIVIAILAGIVTFAYVNQTSAVKDQKRLGDFRSLVSMMDKYYQKNGNYPITCTNSTSSALDCSNLNSTYTSAATTPSKISTNMAASAIKSTVLPDLDNEFAPPGGSSSAPINKEQGGVIRSDSYYLLSPDIVQGTFSQKFQNINGSTFTCYFTATGTNSHGITSTRPHNLIVGGYSDKTKSWAFFNALPRDDQNVISWGTSGSSSECGNYTQLTI